MALARSARCAFTHVHDTNTKFQCSSPVVNDSKLWCHSHNEARKKVYFGYKACHKALDALPELPLPLSELSRCESLGKVKELSAALRKKLSLLTQCIERRAYFTDRFFGNVEDLGHQTYRIILEQELSEIQKMMELAEQRAFALHLTSQNATWVMDGRDPQSDTSDGCELLEEEQEPNSKPITKPTMTSISEDAADPVDLAIEEKRSEIWERIRTRLARYCAPLESRYYTERLDIIRACVCRGVYTDPMLMMLAQNYNTVMDMLQDTTLDFLLVEKLWKAIKELRVDDVRAAIDDVLNPVRVTGEYVVVFGTRVHKDLSPTALTLHGWGHMAAMFPCYSCIRRTCKTVNDIVELTRYTVLCDNRLAWASTLFNFSHSELESLLLCGFIPNTYEQKELQPSVVKYNSLLQRKPCWVEHRQTRIISVGLSLTDPKTQAFVKACKLHQDLITCFREGPKNKVVCSKPLYGPTSRQANTRAGLNDAPWSYSPIFESGEPPLKETCPYIAPGKQVADCLQLVLIHERDVEMKDFINEIVQLWYQVYHVDNPAKLALLIASPYLASNEIELDNNHRIIPNIEVAIHKSYKALWGRPPRQIAVDDEIDAGTL